MTTSNRLWVLGASDPEMAAIETFLRDAGEVVAYAAGPDGARVHPGNAYRAAGFRLPSGEFGTRWDGPVVLVECDGDITPSGDHPLTRVDHHRPGDPGYGRPPEEYLFAASLAQVSKMFVGTDAARAIARDPERVREFAMVCAADHCLEAAYRGRCPGVDPDELMKWRAESRAAFQKRPVEAVLADVEAARAVLREAIRTHEDYVGENEYSVLPVPGEYADLRGQHIPELPEAAAREGIPFLSTVKDRDGREKVVLQAAPPGLVRRFLAGEIVPGLKDVYGDPARGFAGGYV